MAAELPGGAMLLGGAEFLGDAMLLSGAGFWVELGFWVAQRFQRCDQTLLFLRALAPEAFFLALFTPARKPRSTIL
jgi:hypothetical protein